MEIERIEHPTARERRDLVALLRACVAAGASIGFLAPLSAADAGSYWDRVIADLPGGFRALLVARDDGSRTIVGAAQLALEARENGRHRAEVQKVMVLPSHRRRGIAARLMLDLEAIAWAREVSLLFLDTSDGPGGARAFYESLDYRYVGGIPGYALDPDGTPCRNAIFYKTLAPVRQLVSLGRQS